MRKLSGRTGRRQSAGGARRAVGGTRWTDGGTRSARAGTRRLPAWIALIVLGTGLSACGAGDGPDTGPDTAADSASPTPVRLGVDVLLEARLDVVRGRRVGLITNHTGVSWPEEAGRDRETASGAGSPEGPAGTGAVPTIDRLMAVEDVELVALFSPEHGIRGQIEAGETVASDVDPVTGLPIHSLYGETRRPTADMLDGLDLLLFDIQDIGTRYYTYVWTMALAMEAAGEAGLGFVVLDRPNPIGGRLVQGNVLDPEYATFVGLYPVPMRHGLTVGELARMLVGHFGIDVDLTVIPMDGWSRTTWYDDTGLPFIPPSPNMPSLASATHYPGTCLFEGTNLSVGRGTPIAFQQIGAPWLDAEAAATALNQDGLEGVRFEAVTFVPSSPGDRKFGGEEVRGIRFVVTDRERYDPAIAAIAALAVIREQHPDRLEWHVAHFDRLAGTDAIREAILAGEAVPAIVAPWASQVTAFEVLREPYLLYR